MRRARSRACPCASRPSRATSTVSRTVSSGKSVAAWKLRPNPRRARAAVERRVMDFPSSSTAPDEGTKPPIAFINVDLPAPLVPIRPTTSPSPTSIDTRSTATLPPKRTRTLLGAQRGHAVGKRGSRLRLTRRNRVALLGRRRTHAALGPLDDGSAGAVADLDQPAREVEQEHEQSDAGGEQRDQVVVGEERRQTDHPHRPQHRAGD